ncbi:G patch domain-containing protein 11-like [Ylistrum balloti]|uniref:G patch domain-containing protein 11-like n=1 Tax=Ylistrum balloti TaxID=509963 RepID=UPI002905E717|nr:G patch domain-containing protein 11-like [Ylistrum balloti]
MSDDSEDDYMSDAVLLQCKDTRPGLVSSRQAKNYQREEKQKQAKLKNTVKPKKVIENEKREEGLKAAIGSENKGFALLAKMGYKPGMALGKRGEGRSEPVPIELKDGRGGLGRDTQVKRKQAEAVAFRAMISHKRQKMELRQKQHFMSHMSNRFSEQQAERDLYKSQKVCEQLDSQMDIKEPEVYYYWPASHLKHLKKKAQQHVCEEEDYDDDFNDDRNDGIPKKPLRSLHDYEEEEDEEEEEEEVIDTVPITEKLQILTKYLRTKHVYCVWCGTRYNDAEDLESSCPGSTSEAHDE